MNIVMRTVSGGHIESVIKRRTAAHPKKVRKGVGTDGERPSTQIHPLTTGCAYSHRLMKPSKVIGAGIMRKYIKHDGSCE